MELAVIPESGIPESASAVDASVTSWIEANQSYYRTIGFKPPWCAYLCLEHGEVVGTCAFKGAPKEGVVEIAYATHPAMEGRGYATRMALQLIRIARTTAPDVRIIAQTLPELNASAQVLEKCGFTQSRISTDDEVGAVWEWELMK
ncbi:MAG: GNAT family N-acetyltransferase [Flavobacteriales bacterium]|nr:GNAT family N-acetyltransferase [Flavobacteriales bacterium]